MHACVHACARTHTSCNQCIVSTFTLSGADNSQCLSASISPHQGVLMRLRFLSFMICDWLLICRHKLDTFRGMGKLIYYCPWVSSFLVGLIFGEIASRQSLPPILGSNHTNIFEFTSHSSHLVCLLPTYNSFTSSFQPHTFIINTVNNYKCSHYLSCN